MTASALDISRIRAITLDLDDTLWPIWPTIARAEAVLLDWLAEHAPATRALHASTAALRALRDRVQLLRPELSCDLGALRQAVERALDRKRRLGQYAVVWRDGEVATLAPEALPALGPGPTPCASRPPAATLAQTLAAWEPMPLACSTIAVDAGVVVGFAVSTASAQTNPA
ncbi:MAG TPA: hypothetical protein PLJ81_08160, partial [Giesbergeria sp.]|nr:hypothetical protein [Giesbergeria sp.]